MQPGKTPGFGSREDHPLLVSHHFVTDELDQSFREEAIPPKQSLDEALRWFRLGHLPGNPIHIECPATNERRHAFVLLGRVHLVNAATQPSKPLAVTNGVSPLL